MKNTFFNSYLLSWLILYQPHCFFLLILFLFSLTLCCRLALQSKAFGFRLTLKNVALPLLRNHQLTYTNFFATIVNISLYSVSKRCYCLSENSFLRLNILSQCMISCYCSCTLLQKSLNNYQKTPTFIYCLLYALGRCSQIMQRLWIN